MTGGDGPPKRVPMADPFVSFDDIADDFAFIDDWDERYRYLIDLGKRLPAFPEEARGAHTKVRGCASQVWLQMEPQDDGTFTLYGDSDAAIVRGLVGVVMALFGGRTASQILAVDTEDALGRLELKGHITPQRSNGLASMIGTIRAKASAAASA